MRQPTGSPVEARLLETYGYDAVDTCAGDSACKLACPVGIDTGAMMKAFRHQRHSAREERVATLTAEHFRVVEAAARLAVAAAAKMDDRLLPAVTRGLRKMVRPDLMPEWLPAVPGFARHRLPDTSRFDARAVYYPACVDRIFGEPGGGTPGRAWPRPWSLSPPARASRCGSRATYGAPAAPPSGTRRGTSRPTP